MGHIMSHETCDPLSCRGFEKEVKEGIENAYVCRYQKNSVSFCNGAHFLKTGVNYGHNQKEKKLSAVFQADFRTYREER